MLKEIAAILKVLTYHSVRSGIRIMILRPGHQICAQASCGLYGWAHLSLSLSLSIPDEGSAVFAFTGTCLQQQNIATACTSCSDPVRYNILPMYGWVCPLNQVGVANLFL